jgi:signal transduction histidine kinase
MLNAERMRFFTNITHKLRTPLTLILGPLDDLREGSALSTTQSRKIAMIRNSANKLLDLINTILDFRKTETQNKQLAVSHENIELLIRDIGYKYSELNTNTKVTFKTEIEKGEYTLYFDPTVVSTIVENLLSNAVKYCDEGSITLKLYHTVESGVPFTEIAVCDTGI